MRFTVGIIPLCVSLTLTFGRHLQRDARDYDPNGVRPDYPDPYLLTSEDPVPETPESLPEPQPELPEEPDSCEDFPPPSCIHLFEPLPMMLKRDPFAIRNANDLALTCGTWKNGLQCINEFNARCGRFEAQTAISQLLRLLDQCGNEQIVRDSLEASECARRMSSIHERCIRETRFLPQLKSVSTEKLLRGEINSVRDLCCGMRFHKACFMDRVQGSCGVSAHDATQRLERIIFQGFQCDQVPENECPATRP